jgi:hypothetical protein
MGVLGAVPTLAKPAAHRLLRAGEKNESDNDL